jgi:hypothetical protein
MNRRGMSSIIGAIFMILIVWCIASSYFFFTLSQNTSYNQAVKETNNYTIAKLSESVQAINTVYKVLSNNVVTVTVNVQNIGSSPVKFTTLWVYVSEDNWNNYGFVTDLSVTLKAGETLTRDFTVPVQGVTTIGAFNYAAWFTTSKGNTIALRQFNTENIVVSQTTNGIGSLMMDFQDFKHYTFSSTSPYRLNLAGGSSGYTVTTGTGTAIAFKEILTNLDYQNKNDIVLYSGSVFFSIFPTTAQQVRGSYWYIVNVNEQTGDVSNSYTNIVLHYNVPTAVYFASGQAIKTGSPFIPATPVYTGTSPINLAIVGAKGGQAFGQNIPFVSISIS